MKKCISLFAVIAFLIVAISFTSQAQVGSNADYVGIWTGVSKSGVSYEITLNSNWSCTCKLSGVINSDIVGYRIYQGSSGSALTQDQMAVKQAGTTIKFFTQNALNGILCPASGSSQMSAGSVSTTWDQAYSGSVKLDASLTKMTLYVDLDTSPCSVQAHAFSGNPVLLSK